MAKQKKMKLIVHDDVKAKLEKPYTELIERGATDIDMSIVISKVLATAAADQIIDEFVNEQTPESFKIDQLLNNPSERQKVLELLKDKSFGMSGKGGSSGKGLSI